VSKQPGGQLDAYVRTELRRILDERGLSQAWLARRVWISEKHLSTFMQGRNGISQDMAELLLGALGYQLAFCLEPLDPAQP